MQYGFKQKRAFIKMSKKRLRQQTDYHGKFKDLSKF